MHELATLFSNYNDNVKGIGKDKCPKKIASKTSCFQFGNSVLQIKKYEQEFMHFPGRVKYLCLMGTFLDKLMF